MESELVATQQQQSDIINLKSKEITSIKTEDSNEPESYNIVTKEEETKPTIEISSLILQNEQVETIRSEKKVIESSESVAKLGSDNEKQSPSTTNSVEYNTDSDFKTSDSVYNEDTGPVLNGHHNGYSNNGGLQAILGNLSEVIQTQLTPLLESVNLPGINIALATSSNGQISLNNIQQQLAVAQVATATQLQRGGQNANQNQQRLLNTASLLASQLSAAACAAAAVSNTEDQSNKLSSNSANSISPSTSPSLTSSSSSTNWNQGQQQGLNNQGNWQGQQQKGMNGGQGSSAQAAAAAWTSALQNATNSQSNQYHNSRTGGAGNQKNMMAAQQHIKNSSSKGNSLNNILGSGNGINSPNSSTMQQALNSIYSGNQSQQQPKSTNGTNNGSGANTNGAVRNNQTSNNYYMDPTNHSQNKSFELGNDEQEKTQNSNGNGAFDMSNLNSQLVELIRQDPSQIEQILKMKLYQGGGEDVNNLIEELQQLDQTVPANLAAAAAAVVAANNNSNNNISAQQQNPNRNSPRSGGQQHQNYSSNYNLMQQQNLQMAQQHHNSMHGINSHKQFPQNYQQNNFPHNNQFQTQQQQQFHPNFLQLTLQQQQQLSQFQDYHEERFSRKVFVGGLPPDIDEDEIVTHFRRYGNLIVDWPHKAESKSYFPPKGYAFLIFQEERSVQDLIETCVMDDGKLYMVVSSPSMKDKPVQIRPWCLNDSDFVMDGSQPLDPRKTIFVGGVPRPLKAIELAMIMDRFYGGVCYAGIDTDPELKYPKGAGRVAFSNQQSYIAAISARFVQLQHGEIDKRVEVKPYVLDDQMCDECQGARCGGKFAPFFCANVTCLQYYCEACWATIHTRQGREYHKPLVKEGADRPRPIPYK